MRHNNKLIGYANKKLLRRERGKRLYLSPTGLEVALAADAALLAGLTGQFPTLRS